MNYVTQWGKEKASPNWDDVQAITPSPVSHLVR